MEAERIDFRTVGEAAEAIEGIGASNSALMAARAVHINARLRAVPREDARRLKTVYNDIGAEAAVSHGAYYEESGPPTDMIVMGTLYHHREARRIAGDDERLGPLVSAIERVVERAPEATE